MKHQYIIGIDPDTVKSGVAHLNTHTRGLELITLSFWELYEYLKVIKELHGDHFIVMIEGGWLVDKSNFHYVHGSRGQRIAKNVGSNHETGRKIVEMCEYLGIEHKIVHPLTKIWSGPKRKITHQELACFTGISQRSTNQEERDAALIVWEHAGLPIRIMPTKIQERKPVVRESK